VHCAYEDTVIGYGDSYSKSIALRSVGGHDFLHFIPRAGVVFFEHIRCPGIDEWVSSAGIGILMVGTDDGHLVGEGDGSAEQITL